MEQMSNAMRRRMLTEVLNLLASGQSPEIHLVKAPIVVPAEPVPADFTEADFTTYAALPLPTPTAAYNTPDGSAEADYGDISWVLSADPATGNLIYGYWVDALVSGVRTVMFWEDLPTSPTPMQAAGNSVVLSVPVVIPGPGSATQID